jgi:hypothetical protein
MYVTADQLPTWVAQPEVRTARARDEERGLMRLLACFAAVATFGRNKVNIRFL